MWWASGRGYVGGGRGARWHGGSTRQRRSPPPECLFAFPQIVDSLENVDVVMAACTGRGGVSWRLVGYEPCVCRLTPLYLSPGAHTRLHRVWRLRCGDGRPDRRVRCLNVADACGAGAARMMRVCLHKGAPLFCLGFAPSTTRSSARPPQPCRECPVVDLSMLVARRLVAVQAERIAANGGSAVPASSN